MSCDAYIRSLGGRGLMYSACSWMIGRLFRDTVWPGLTRPRRGLALALVSVDFLASTSVRFWPRQEWPIMPVSVGMTAARRLSERPHPINPYTVLQSQTVVSAYLKSKQILPFGFARQYSSEIFNLHFNHLVVSRYRDSQLLSSDWKSLRFVQLNQIPANTRRWANVGLTLAHRLRLRISVSQISDIFHF